MSIKQWISGIEHRVEDGRSRLKRQNIRSMTHIKEEIGHAHHVTPSTNRVNVEIGFKIIDPTSKFYASLSFVQSAKRLIDRWSILIQNSMTYKSKLHWKDS